MNKLEGHITMLIDDECWTFPLPLLADTMISNWGWGEPGDFEQRIWSEAEQAAWKLKHEACAKYNRRWAWLKHLSVRFPTFVNGGELEWRRFGPWLLERLVKYEPSVGTHYVYHNQAQYFALYGKNVTVSDYVVVNPTGKRST